MNLEIATRLVQLRKANGYSQEALAEKLGVSRQAISKWERAESSPDTDNLIALASLYGMSLDTLLNAEKDTYILNGTPEEAEKEAPAPLPKTELQKKGAMLLKFPIPLVAVLLFLFLGFGLHLWHPGWLVFLLIPIYYHFAAALTVRKTAYNACSRSDCFGLLVLRICLQYLESDLGFISDYSFILLAGCLFL